MDSIICDFVRNFSDSRPSLFLAMGLLPVDVYIQYPWLIPAGQVEREKHRLYMPEMWPQVHDFHMAGFYKPPCLEQKAAEMSCLPGEKLVQGCER